MKDHDEYNEVSASLYDQIVRDEAEADLEALTNQILWGIVITSVTVSTVLYVVFVELAIFETALGKAWHSIF